MRTTALLLIDVQRGAFNGVLHSPINQPALANGFAVTIARDGHSTRPSRELSAETIKAQSNAALAEAGATLRSVANFEALLSAAALGLCRI